MEISLSQRIVRYLRSKPGAWENGGELERLALLAGYKSSNCSRRCRELYVKGFIDRRENEKGHVEYKAVESEKLFVDA